MTNKDFKQLNIDTQNTEQNTRQIIDGFLYNFRGNNKNQRGNAWNLTGSSTSFLTSVATVSNSIVPTSNNTYSLGDVSYKWADIETVKINNVTPLAGTKVYYVADSSGGAVTRKLTFTNGILTSET